MSPICKQCGSEVPYLVIYNARYVCPRCADKNATETLKRNEAIIDIIKANPRKLLLVDIHKQLKERGIILPFRTLWQNAGKLVTLRMIGKDSDNHYFLEDQRNVPKNP